MRVCVYECVWRTRERQKDTDSRWDSAGPSQSRAMWLEMAVNRRHARLSVKLETSGAQLTAVRTSVCSHRPGIRGRQQGELEAETHFTSQSIMICDWTKQALCSLQTALDSCCCQVCTSYTTRMSAELLLQSPFGLQVFDSRSVPGMKMFPNLSHPWTVLSLFTRWLWHICESKTCASSDVESFLIWKLLPGLIWKLTSVRHVGPNQRIEALSHAFDRQS